MDLLLVRLLGRRRRTTDRGGRKREVSFTSTRSNVRFPELPLPPAADLLFSRWTVQTQPLRHPIISHVHTDDDHVRRTSRRGAFCGAPGAREWEPCRECMPNVAELTRSNKGEGRELGLYRCIISPGRLPLRERKRGGREKGARATMGVRSQKTAQAFGPALSSYTVFWDRIDFRLRNSRERWSVRMVRLQRGSLRVKQTDSLNQSMKQGRLAEQLRLPNRPGTDE